MSCVTPHNLIAFEDEIAAAFKRGEIRAPVHLSGGNEMQLIQLFKNIGPDDWICSTWRSHYHALLRGIPTQQVRRQIMEGRSMFISSLPHKFLSSAIMGGMLPIACGLAFQGKRVWCFVGDMCASIGAFHDAVKFASGYQLDIKFVVEDNGLSTDTPTERAWNYGGYDERYVLRYKYERTRGHYETGHGFRF